MSAPDRVFREGAWELRIWYRRRSTPIEYQHGVLYHDGRRVKGAGPGYELDTPLGRLRYFGSKQTGFAADLAPTGWNFADRRVGSSWSEGLQKVLRSGSRDDTSG
jgi:hypothetical protein